MTKQEEYDQKTLKVYSDLAMVDWPPGYYTRREEVHEKLQCALKMMFPINLEDPK